MGGTLSELPPRAAAFSEVGGPTPASDGSPPITRTARRVPCPLPRRIGRCACRLHPRAGSTSTLLEASLRPRLYSRGVLRLQSRYGPAVASTADGALCRREAYRPSPNRELAWFSYLPFHGVEDGDDLRVHRDLTLAPNARAPRGSRGSHQHGAGLRAPCHDAARPPTLSLGLAEWLPPV